MAQLYLKQEQYAESVEYYGQWLENKNERTPQDSFWLAQYYYMNNQIQKTIDSLEKSTVCTKREMNLRNKSYYSF